MEAAPMIWTPSTQGTLIPCIPTTKQLDQKEYPEDTDDYKCHINNLLTPGKLAKLKTCGEALYHSEHGYLEITERKSDKEWVTKSKTD